MSLKSLLPIDTEVLTFHHEGRTEDEQPYRRVLASGLMDREEVYLRTCRDLREIGNPYGTLKRASEGGCVCALPRKLAGLEAVRTPGSFALEELHTSVGNREPISFEGVEVWNRGSNVRSLCVDDTGCHETVRYKG